MPERARSAGRVSLQRQHRYFVCRYWPASREPQRSTFNRFAS